MRIGVFLTALVGLLAGSNPAAALDLTKVPRAIARQPAYAGRPQYCLLVFGAAAQTHVWLVLDGNVLYVDRNGNGDLSEPGERVTISPGEQVFEVGDIVERDGKTLHTGLEVKVRPTIRLSIALRGKRLQYTDGNLKFAGRPQDAPIVHFNGPLTMRLGHSRLELPRGEQVIPKLMADIGTPGLGPETFAPISKEEIPFTSEPVAEVEFADRDGGAKPIIVRTSLRH
jgi:hypothetical protein